MKTIKNRMKTIKDAAEAYVAAVEKGRGYSTKKGACIWDEDCSFECGFSNGSREGFVAGVAFAQRWIPVTEAKPGGRIFVLVKTTTGGIHRARWDGDVQKWIGHRLNTELPNVSHWRFLDMGI
jgi:hypothetical protein